MPCYKPLATLRSTTSFTKTGKSVIYFLGKSYDVSLHSSPNFMWLPCSRCVGCRLERSRQWAIRCIHEASLHTFNSFITLTYSPEFLPDPPSLNKKHFQDFMKRLRFHFSSIPIRFFHCGEYGERYRRPHYHAILFGLDFDDKFYCGDSNGQPLFRSPSLDSIWGFGACRIGSVTFESAAYVARYIMKKYSGENYDYHYGVISTEGEITSILSPEYTTMSRRSGIGKEWFDEFYKDVFPSDEVVIRGRKMRPPRYYDSLYEILSPLEMQSIKESRRTEALKFSSNSTPDRLAIREKVKLSRIKNLVRTLEE